MIPSNGDAAPEPISSEPNLTRMATQYQRRAFPFVLEKFTSAQQFKKTPISRSDFRLVCHKGFVQAFELRRIAVFPSVNTLMKISATLTGFEPTFKFRNLTRFRPKYAQEFALVPGVVSFW